jgi:hypothetical protein
MNDPWDLQYSPFPLPPASEKKEQEGKKQGGAACFVTFDKLSITLVVSGLPIGSVVCLSRCHDDVDYSCESVGQSVYGPHIGFLGHFDPCRCRTSWCDTSSHVAGSLQCAHLRWLFKCVYVLRVTCIKFGFL